MKINEERKKKKKKKKPQGGGRKKRGVFFERGIIYLYNVWG